MGVPSDSDIHPGMVLTPNRFARVILFPATELIDASNINGGCDLVGAAIAIGFKPTRRSAPPVGTTVTPPVVIAIPTMSCSRANAA